MKASLIEIDHNVAPPLWYAILAGQRFWCQEAREMLISDGWMVLPGQGLPESHNLLIFPEHAWTVREGEVELVLREVVPAEQQGALPLADGLS